MKLYQTCPKCSFSIKIKREQVKCWGTPYYHWKFVDEVECPNGASTLRVQCSHYFK